MKFVDHPQEEPANPDSIAPAVTTGRAPARADVSPAPDPGQKDVNTIENGASRHIAAGIYTLHWPISIWRSSRIPLARIAMSIAGLSCIAWAI